MAIRTSTQATDVVANITAGYKTLVYVESAKVTKLADLKNLLLTASEVSFENSTDTEEMVLMGETKKTYVPTIDDGGVTFTLKRVKDMEVFKILEDAKNNRTQVYVCRFLDKSTMIGEQTPMIVTKADIKISTDGIVEEDFELKPAGETEALDLSAEVAA